MKAKDCIELLRSNSVFWSKLGFCYDPPRMDKSGKPIVFFENFERFAKFHRDFTKAGVKIHSSILFNGWVGVDQYDYELTDKVLGALFKDNPDIYYIPRIKLNVPIDWGKENPEDVFVYYEGPRDAESIRKLVETSKHDLLGYNSPGGYYTAGGWQDDRPNVDGLIANQSFSSKKWLKDAGDALGRLLRHLEEGPYGKQILAYHIAYGTSGETCLWGRISGRFGDYGVANRKAFFEWGMEKHGSLEELRKAWNNPVLDANSSEPPPPELREGFPKTMEEFFRGTPEKQICVDYDKFMTDVNVDAIEHFGKIVKDKTQGKAVGSFYGYFLSVSRSAYTGHLGFARLLNSPYLDFLAGPKSYYRNGPGDPGGELAPAQSINRKKIWMDELDNRTHLCATAERECETLEETRTVMWREFSKNLSHNSGFWWMDLGGGWYDSPDVLKEIGEIENVSREIHKRPWKSVSEMLLVVDEDSLFHSTANDSAHTLFLNEFACEIRLCGAPVDMYRLKDLEDLDLSPYKLICFLNTFKFDCGQWERIEKRLPERATLFWNYAPGLLNPGFSLDNVKRITGFKIRERSITPRPRILPDADGILKETACMEHIGNVKFPLVEIINTPDIQPLGHYCDGGIALAEMSHPAGRKYIYCALPLLKTQHLRIIAEASGCHMYTPVNCTVYADCRFIGVFPKNDTEGELQLRQATDMTDVRTGKKWNKIKAVPLRMKAKSAKFFILNLKDN